MKFLWCWRCKTEMPMLDEEEFAEVSRLRASGIRDAKKYREQYGVSLSDFSSGKHFRPMLECYERLTGMKETNSNAVMHHRLSLYGPPCKRCGKPLRTPQAKLCGSCMFPVVE
jgi:hypothetical protein